MGTISEMNRNEPGRASPASPRHLLWGSLAADVVGVSLLAVVLACVGLHWTGIHRIHVNGANDQVGYITAARELVDHGRITGHLIYPSCLLQKAKKSVFYMPGFYCCLAASYKLFGFGAIQSLLPSLVGYITATACTYLIARRFYGRGTGWLAAALFAGYPPNLFYACNAMSEMSVTASAVAAFCAFVYLPRRGRLFAGPALLVIPFLFRDTNAFLVAPMAVILCAEGGVPGFGCHWQLACQRLLHNRNTGGQAARGTRVLGRLSGAAGFVLASVVLLGLVNASPVAAGRPSFIKAAVFDDSPATAFGDAIAQENLRPGAGDWARALAHQFVDNARFCFIAVTTKLNTFDAGSMMPLLLVVPLGLGWGMFKRDSLALACGAFVLIMLCFIFAFNGVREGKGLRLAMVGAPFAVVLAARLWLGLCVAAAGVMKRPALAGAFAVMAPIGLLFVAVPAVWRVAGEFKKYDNFDPAVTSIIEGLGHDDRTLLVGPPGLCLPYVYQHYPVFWSFVPSNEATFKLLSAKWTIDTAVLESDTILTAADMERAGLALYRRITLAGATVTVYKRPTRDGKSGAWPLADQLIAPEVLGLPEPPPPPPPPRRRGSRKLGVGASSLPATGP